MTLSVLETFLADLAARRYQLDEGESDLARIRHLVRRYADLRLGLVDAAVIACAERRGCPVLTLDRRHFDGVAREGTISILP
jgi:predicted nucleic acid-binding protein